MNVRACYTYLQLCIALLFSTVHVITVCYVYTTTSEKNPLWLGVDMLEQSQNVAWERGLRSTNRQ